MTFSRAWLNTIEHMPRSQVRGRGEGVERGKKQTYIWRGAGLVCVCAACSRLPRSVCNLGDQSSTDDWLSGCLAGRLRPPTIDRPIHPSNSIHQSTPS